MRDYNIGIVLDALDAQEGAGPGSSSGYRKIDVTVTTYAGEELLAYIYSKTLAPGPDGLPIERPCSARYLKILVSGAQSAGLNPDYIERLAKLPTYTPSAETLALVRAFPPRVRAALLLARQLVAVPRRLSGCRAAAPRYS